VQGCENIGGVAVPDQLVVMVMHGDFRAVRETVMSKDDMSLRFALFIIQQSRDFFELLGYLT
jgi:hypothetical protein